MLFKIIAAVNSVVQYATEFKSRIKGSIELDSQQIL